MTTITGKIKRETEKAVLLVNRAGQAWFPKSRCEIMERAMGPLDQIMAPEWLLKDATISMMATVQY